MKVNEMDKAYSTHGISEKYWQHFGMESFKERGYLGYLSEIKGIILKWIT
jgi:hypothetical protein